MDDQSAKRIEGLAVNLAAAIFGILFLTLFLLQLSRKAILAAILFLILFLLVVAAAIYGNMKLFGPKKDIVYKEGQLKTTQDYQNALYNMNPKCFQQQIQTSASQLQRLDDKLIHLDNALKAYFGGSQISYSKYKRAIEGLDALYLDNLQKLMNRISVFDYAGYTSLLSAQKEYTPEFAPYTASIEYVNQKVDDNEKILASLDHLLLEVAKLDDTTLALEDLSAMREIQELIENTKLYKH